MFASIIFRAPHSMYGKEAMGMKRVLAAVTLFAAVIYLKYCLPGFVEDFLPLMRQWLAMEQIAIPVPEEAMAWLLLP